MSAVLLDTHVVQWWSAEPDRISSEATARIAAAEELLVAAVSWYELAWLARHGRISVAIPVRSWLGQLAAQVLTVAITPQIADTAAALSDAFSGDPADRLIYASALERGVPLVTKDRRLRAAGPAVAIW